LLGESHLLVALESFGMSLNLKDVELVEAMVVD
jgi:hypothetical protein